VNGWLLLTVLEGLMMAVIDVGAGEDPDPRADLQSDIRPPADCLFDAGGGWPLQDASVTGVVAHHVLEHLPDPTVFFGEAGRVLKPRGWLEVSVPLGSDAVTDLDHEHIWRYATPEQFCSEQQRPWDPDTAFRLISRRLEVWGYGPESFWSHAPMQWIADQWPAWAAHRCPAGELTATYRRGETGC